MEDWRKYYNEVRPRGAIGQKPPISLLNHDGAASLAPGEKPENSNLRQIQSWGPEQPQGLYTFERDQLGDHVTSLSYVPSLG